MRPLLACLAALACTPPARPAETRAPTSTPSPTRPTEARATTSTPTGASTPSPTGARAPTSTEASTPSPTGARAPTSTPTGASTPSPTGARAPTSTPTDASTPSPTRARAPTSTPSPATLQPTPGCFDPETHGPLRSVHGPWHIYASLVGPNHLFLEHRGPRQATGMPAVEQLRARISSDAIGDPIFGLGIGACPLRPGEKLPEPAPWPPGAATQRRLCISLWYRAGVALTELTRVLDAALGPDGAASCYGVTVELLAEPPRIEFFHGRVTRTSSAGSRGSS